MRRTGGRTARACASRAERCATASTTRPEVHKILASISDDEERFAAIATPPEGKSRWTPDEANRRVGRQVVKPVTAQEKVSAIQSLAQDEEVAGRVTGDLLRRPEVVAQVRDEDKVRVVEELTREDEVAAAVAPEFLRRPAVVARVGKADKVHCHGSSVRSGTLRPRRPPFHRGVTAVRSARAFSSDRASCVGDWCERRE
ncbi:DUF6192 family protein [Streptomyces asiaticus]|uniref:DUF6192 family protein n=1 Tax=Streptomyces asiaticus TaxID=114695 RepID=UPI003F67F08A